jgi:hypothetical protein
LFKGIPLSEHFLLALGSTLELSVCALDYVKDIMKRLVSTLSAIALIAAGFVAGAAPAHATGLTATVADSTAQTEYPDPIFKVGDKLVYYGKVPATGNYDLAYLDGT